MGKIYDNILRLVDMVMRGLFDKQAIYPSKQCIFQRGEVFAQKSKLFVWIYWFIEIS